ncbi:extracellular solute-binding protein [Paenibacillus sp. YN15]|uniref:extracellular solute-binding protein n=1 Tax=Paenibacillus sp. YN15 TaxID=1742774 RepID=UPI000DCF2923|nr:extracellular solute-binding protein [Paenibacillus sp. YN15]RAV02322.1 ABC transporter substrate-binding protein [Paenibacillus sp. YN15]
MKNKWLLIPVVASLALASTACGGSSGDEAGGAASPAASATVAATSGPKPELKALMRWMKDDYNTYPVAKMLEEKTGYKVMYDMLPADKPADKLNLLIASSEPYDLISVGGDNTFKALYADYAQKGALVDLTPLIDKYGPNIKKAISQKSFDAIKVNGKIFAIPHTTSVTVGSDLMIRKDWLDKLGLPVPTTLDELTNVLKQFKDKDPGGNGSNNLPLSLRGDAPMLDNVIGAFGLSNAWNDVGGKLIPRAMDPAFKDYLTYMSDLYKQGLIDKEFAINKDATVKEKFTSGKVGVIPVNWADVPTIADALKKNVPTAEYLYLPALKGKDGKAGFGASFGFDRLTFVPKSSKHPEDAVKYMNAKLEEETFKNMAIGEEGKHYTFKDGVYSPILPIFNDERNQATNYLTGIDEVKYPIYWQARVRKDQRLFDAWDYLNQKQPSELKFANPLGLAPYLAQYAKDNAQLEQLVTDYATKVIVGGEQVSGLDAFIAKYKAAGADASYKEVNDWYATVKK